MRRIDQLLNVAGLVTLGLEEYGLRAILVGGSAVAVYTHGSLATFDVDFVVQGRQDALDVLRKLGFKEGKSRGVWWYPHLNIPVEIPDTHLEGDLARVVDVTLESGLQVHVIGVDDLVLDRIDQAAASGSPVSDVRRQAVLLMATYWEDLDLAYIRQQATQRRTAEYCEALITEAYQQKQVSPQL